MVQARQGCGAGHHSRYSSVPQIWLQIVPPLALHPCTAYLAAWTGVGRPALHSIALFSRASGRKTQPCVRLLGRARAGLHFLHSSHVIHRDLKSKNILMSRDGRAKLADVGLAQLLRGQSYRNDGFRGTWSWAGEYRSLLGTSYRAHCIKIRGHVAPGPGRVTSLTVAWHGTAFGAGGWGAVSPGCSAP